MFIILVVGSDLQVICWVLGEYGTAGGKYSASYITGKLCDVAEAHSSNDTVKVFLSLYEFCVCIGFVRFLLVNQV